MPRIGLKGSSGEIGQRLRQQWQFQHLLVHSQYSSWQKGSSPSFHPADFSFNNAPISNGTPSWTSPANPKKPCSSSPPPPAPSPSMKVDLCHRTHNQPTPSALDLLRTRRGPDGHTRETRSFWRKQLITQPSVAEVFVQLGTLRGFMWVSAFGHVVDNVFLAR
ncbi:hypothetical protein DOTSEDRAFT_38549 [Dothistroma septosporum NZE10]|uniref:Uncharacterized protein n=1 Tax=Dothistroma septosporum (strain NZE10 / CBS 128990) TaxID=675120 RepID=M2YK56_DOTSN|nr:hypothetical protein DOTSEDRAFT_38549 [Dothistroma septosporum NZE10]